MGLSRIKAHTKIYKGVKILHRVDDNTKGIYIKEKTRKLALDSGASGLIERRQDNKHIKGIMF
jgi:hypothetical protein